MNERTSGKDSASSPDELTVFQAYMDLINSEQETLWARHNALLMANSLIVGSLAPQRYGRINGSSRHSGRWSHH